MLVRQEVYQAQVDKSIIQRHEILCVTLSSPPEKRRKDKNVDFETVLPLYEDKEYWASKFVSPGGLVGVKIF